MVSFRPSRNCHLKIRSKVVEQLLVSPSKTVSSLVPWLVAQFSSWCQKLNHLVCPSLRSVGLSNLRNTLLLPRAKVKLTVTVGTINPSPQGSDNYLLPRVPNTESKMFRVVSENALDLLPFRLSYLSDTVFSYHFVILVCLSFCFSFNCRSHG